MKLHGPLTCLEDIEKHSFGSTLVIYKPKDEHAKFYQTLCNVYLKSCPSDGCPTGMK
jgi:hypothetical protein